MNQSHDWHFPSTKTLERIEDHEKLLTRILVLNDNYRDKVEKDRNRVDILKRLIKKQLEKLVEPSTEIEKNKWNYKQEFNRKLIRRYLFTLEIPLQFKQSDDKCNHISV